MNREIKFRAISKEREWVYGNLCENINGEICIQKIVRKINDGFAVPSITIPIDEETIGQFTGLTDKKENEIYEADLLKTLNGTIVVVEWVEAGFNITNVNDKLSTTSLTKNIVEKLELTIIGNIYNNKELLEV